MDLETVENFIRQVCLRLNEEYADYCTVSAGKLDGEGCPDVCFHVKSEAATYRMLVTSALTVVRHNSQEVARYEDLTKAQFFTPED